MKNAKKYISLLLLTLLINNKINNEFVYAKVNDMIDINEDDIIKIIKDTKVYLGPSTKYEIVGNLNKNDEIVIFDKSINDFIYIDSNKVSGFIKKDSITEKDLDKEKVFYESSFNNEFIKANDNVFIRKDNNINSKKIGLLYNGEKIQVLDEDNYGNWYQVKYNNNIGYVYKKYADKIFNWNFPNNYYKVAYLNTDITIPGGMYESDKVTIANKHDIHLVYSEDDKTYTTTNIDGDSIIRTYKEDFTIIEDKIFNKTLKK